MAQLRASIREFGFTNPLLVDDENRVIAGHGRLQAALAEGMTEVPAIELRGLTEAQKRALVIADNQLALNAGWDADLLRYEIEALSADGLDLSLLGFDAEELAGILAPPMNAGLTDPDEVPPLPEVPVTQPGDVWQCGAHRVMCGDCRNAADVTHLIGTTRINVAFTSPPYAEQREYDVASGFKPIHPDTYVEWFAPVAANVARVLADDGSWFVNIKPAVDGLDTSLYVFDLVTSHVRAWDWHFATEFCWERNGMPKSVTQRFKNQFEPIYQFARGRWKMRPEAVRHESANVPKAGGKGIGDTIWAGDQGSKREMFGGARKRRNGTGKPMCNVQGVNKEPGEYIVSGLAFPGNRLPTFTSSHQALGHAAAFPVGLAEFFINAYTDAGDAIFDPFLGSGSTLIAAQRTDRIGFGMELSPAYVDMAVLRWQAFTGHTATLERTGEPYAQKQSAA